jgi:hypothetical protein
MLLFIGIVFDADPDQDPRIRFSTLLPIQIRIRVFIETPFRKNSTEYTRNGFIPRKKVLLARNSVCPGVVHSEVRNETERYGIPRKNKV